MKKPSRPGWPGSERRSAALEGLAPGSVRAFEGTSAESEDALGPRVLPAMERLHQIDPRELPAASEAWANRGPSAAARRSPGAPGRRAQVIDDRQDDELVYPHPPVRPHPVGRFERLLSRSTPAFQAAAFIGLLTAAATAAHALHGLEWRPEAIAATAVRIGSASMLGLLPAAVLLWRPDAWRSARLILAAAVLWGLAPAYVGLAWLIARDLVGPYLVLGPALTAALAGATVAASVAPLLMAIGLDRARNARDSDLSYLMPRSALAAVFLTGVAVSGWGSTRVGLALPASIPGDPGWLAVIARAAAVPVEIAGLAMIAYVCLAAAADAAPQGRFWQLTGAGVAVLAVAASWELCGAQLLANVWMGPTGGDGSLAVAWAQAAGFGLVLLGFGSPVWSLARDAEPGMGAPEEVFAWGSAADITGEAGVAAGSVVMVAAGADHALAVDDRGRVVAWGENAAGQLDVPDGLGPVKSIAAGDRFSLVLRADGSVVGWGANEFGQAEPPDGLPPAVSVSAGGDFGLALLPDGTVAAWGNPASPALAVPAGLGDVIAIAAGRRHALALRSNGLVVAWGSPDAGPLRPPPWVSGATAIAAGCDFSMALLGNGTVVAWGDNSYGQLDVPSTLRGVTAIAAGSFHGVALCADGAVVSWGSGRLEREGSHPWRLVDFRAVAAGHEYSLAVRVAQPLRAAFRAT